MSITLFLIILTVLVSFTAFRNSLMLERMKFNAFEISKRKSFYRFFSYGLLHADWMHLVVNMFVLFSFGSTVENILVQEFEAIGRFFFLMLYVSSLLFSTLPSYFRHRKNYYYNAVGASGAVSAVLFASIILNPEGSVFIMFIPIPIPAFVFGLFYLVYSAYMAKRGTDNIGHDVHFWGAVFGIVYISIINPDFLLEFIRAIL
ncbi:MAG TPA: rhomboid family intramembrane serine protease [Bacteroidales bacterium]|nr:rhomboid family intramembrane serine protease [Bacteroidales bacterium]